MASFSQWMVQVQKDPEPKQFTWIGGTEQILIEEVVRQIREQLQPHEWNLSELRAGTVVSERELWAEVDQHPLDNQNRLVIIRDAEKIQWTVSLLDFYKHRAMNPKTHLVLVSNQERAPKIAAKEGDDSTKVYPDYMQPFVKSTGRLIECRPFTASTVRYAVAWVRTRCEMSDREAGHLLNRADGDLRLVRDVATKMKAFPDGPSISLINSLLAQKPRDSFVDALLAVDKKTALASLRTVPRSDYSRIIGLLDSNVELAGHVHDLQAERKSNAEIVKLMGSRGFLLQDVAKVSKHYTKARRLQIRKTLAKIDEALQMGADEAAMETLVSLW